MPTSEYNRAYREKNRERLDAYAKAYREKNREALRERQRTYLEKNRKEHNRKKRLQPYDLTQDELNAMMAEQNGVCKVCGCPPTGKGPNAVLHIDHDHDTGKVRGLLCQACNRGLGFFRDDPERLAAAINYLRDVSTKN